MRAIIILASIVLISLGCERNTKIQIASNRNIYIDDSLFQLYVPLTIFDSIVEGEQIRGNYAHKYINRDRPNTSVQILYAWDKEKANSYSDNELDLLFRKEINDIRDDQANETFVSLDTLMINETKVGVLKKVVGCGTDASVITSCFLLSPFKNRVYKVIISSDKSVKGDQLKDSISTIIESLYFAPKEAKAYNINNG